MAFAKGASRPATIYDVTRRAGVSHQTVSRMIIGGVRVSPHILGRVNAPCSDLHVGVNPSARDLWFGRSPTVGVVVDVADLSAPAGMLLQELGRRTRADEVEWSGAVNRPRASSSLEVLASRGGDRFVSEGSSPGTSAVHGNGRESTQDDSTQEAAHTGQADR